MADNATAASASSSTAANTAAVATQAADAAKAADPKAPAAAKTDSNGKVEGKAAADGTVTKTDAKTFTVKVDGKDVTVSEEELLKGYSKVAAADKRMKEASDSKKLAESEKAKLNKIVAAARAGDYSALREAGFSDDEIQKLSEKVIYDQIQVQLEQERVRSLNPEQRELEELRKQKAEWDKTSKAAKEKEQTEARTAKVAEVQQKFKDHVIQTLEQFPPEYKANDVFAQLVVDAWAHCYENDIQETPEHVGQVVANEFRSLYKLMVSKAKDEELPEYVPDAVKDRLLNIAKAKLAGEAHPALTSQPQVREEKKAPERPKRVTQAQLMRRAYTFAKDREK